MLRKRLSEVERSREGERSREVERGRERSREREGGREKERLALISLITGRHTDTGTDTDTDMQAHKSIQTLPPLLIKGPSQTTVSN